MPYTYYKRLVLDPERVRSVHRVDDTTAVETFVRFRDGGGEWVGVPGDSLASADQDHLLEEISEAEAEQLTGNAP